MSPEQGWYAVALSNGLDAGTSAGTRLFGKELVVWRDSAGASHVWEDRCPHRGMRLSFGFVRGNHIACLYHGWQYDEAGFCRYVPAHPKLEVPDTIRVSTYPSAEAGGMVWVWWGEGAPDAAPAERAAVPVRSLYVDRAPEGVAVALAAGTPWSITSTADRVFTASISGAVVSLVLQPFDDDRTAIHLVISGQGAESLAVAEWAEELRSFLESGSPLPVYSPLAAVTV